MWLPQGHVSVGASGARECGCTRGMCWCIRALCQAELLGCLLSHCYLTRAPLHAVLAC